jgi:glycine cleavage system aminomethyltransferase T
MTTTTAAAGLVMRHLDFVLQVLRPDWDVQVVSVTEQWAQFSVAGPLAREVVAAIVDQPVDDASLPYMGCGPVTVSGIGGRVFRISFSGEMGFEIAVPARYGGSLYRLLVAQAEIMGGGPYGMEALNVLRIEKGFITHAEIHGRVTALTSGWSGWCRRRRTASGSPCRGGRGFWREEREQLVGLRPVDPAGQVTAGAHLFAERAEAVRVNDEGYVTSVCWSPTLETGLALGFLKRGRARHGEVVRLVDHLRGWRRSAR